MKTICFYFQVRRPIRLKRYRFFSIGRDHNYLDGEANANATQKVARKCYLPMNALLLKLIKDNKGTFRVSFSMSGLAVEQFREFAPEVLESFRELAATGCVEFLGETYAHSLSSLIDNEEFSEQVARHSRLIAREFGQKPTAFRNTELIYSDTIAETVAALGFKTMVAEGARHILGWRSPNFVYASALNQKLRLLLRNYKLSDDLSLRFSDRQWGEWPLTTEKYVEWLTSADIRGDVVNLFMDYETFGEHQWAESGIFEFMKQLPRIALRSGKLTFATISEASSGHHPEAVLSSHYPMSWTDEERDISAWLGNELQNEAFSKLYALRNKVKAVDLPDFDHVWEFMQYSDHFYNMATKWLANDHAYRHANPYPSSYDAFINYMNVLSDFAIRLDKQLSAQNSTQETAKEAAQEEMMLSAVAG